MDLKGQNIPRATMTAYLKDKLKKTKISTQFIEGMLFVSKQYITKISNQANQICTNQNKKTISLDHLYKSIEHFKLSKQMEELKKVQQQIKEDNDVNYEQTQRKIQIKKEIQKNYNEMVKENGIHILPNSDLPLLKQINPSSVLIISSDEQDYENNSEIEEDQKVKNVTVIGEKI